MMFVQLLNAIEIELQSGTKTIDVSTFANHFYLQIMLFAAIAFVLINKTYIVNIINNNIEIAIIIQICISSAIGESRRIKSPAFGCVFKFGSAFVFKSIISKLNNR